MKKRLSAVCVSHLREFPQVTQLKPPRLHKTENTHLHAMQDTGNQAHTSLYRRSHLTAVQKVADGQNSCKYTAKRLISR